MICFSEIPETAGPDLEFFRSAAEFAAVQQEQGEALAAGQAQDMLSWLTVREQVFRHLAQSLSCLAVECRGDEGLLLRARERIGVLLENEKELAVIANIQRLRMQEQRQAMCRGREALQGYGSHDGAAFRPRYLSSRL